MLFFNRYNIANGEALYTTFG